MPLAIPSHVGLVAPLWRRWPRIFDTAALCLGAVLPDVVDGAIGVGRGHLGQGIGHSLIGMVLLCLPLGLLARSALHTLAPRRVPPSAGRRGPVVLSVVIGTASHVLSDFVSHDGGPLLHPLPRWQPFPAWWSDPWFFMPVPGYPGGYPFAPHFVVWCVISVLGVWLLVRPVGRRPTRGGP
jgi:hypothetical protein